MAEKIIIYASKRVRFLTGKEKLIYFQTKIA